MFSHGTSRKLFSHKKYHAIIMRNKYLFSMPLSRQYGKREKTWDYMLYNTFHVGYCDFFSSFLKNGSCYIKFASHLLLFGTLMRVLFIITTLTAAAVVVSHIAYGNRLTFRLDLNIKKKFYVWRKRKPPS